MNEQDATHWTDLLDSEDLPDGGRRVIKTPDGKQIALFRLSDGTLRACNNRCPHEGYPLSEGSLSEGSLSEGGFPKGGFPKGAQAVC